MTKPKARAALDQRIGALLVAAQKFGHHPEATGADVAWSASAIATLTSLQAAPVEPERSVYCDRGLIVL